MIKKAIPERRKARHEKGKVPTFPPLKAEDIDVAEELWFEDPGSGGYKLAFNHSKFNGIPLNEVPFSTLEWYRNIFAAEHVRVCRTMPILHLAYLCLAQ